MCKRYKYISATTSLVSVAMVTTVIEGSLPAFYEKKIQEIVVV